jgi:hypothetical protein
MNKTDVSWVLQKAEDLGDQEGDAHTATDEEDPGVPRHGGVYAAIRAVDLFKRMGRRRLK